MHIASFGILSTVKLEMRYHSQFALLRCAGISTRSGAKYAPIILSKRATIEVPDTDPFITPLLYALPIQLLAYHTAVAKGTDVDQPRNLAKSVTVE